MSSLHFEPLAPALARLGWPVHAPGNAAALRDLEVQVAAVRRHGDTPRWQRAIDALPQLVARHYELSADRVQIGSGEQCPNALRQAIRESLHALCPWRKGPFDVFGIDIDAEWRSDMKWARVVRAARPFAGRRVLDVGCGNGYYCLRALGAGAELVLGVDPSLLYVLQFEALLRFLPPLPALLLPIGIEALPLHPVGFDSVLSMGVLYHRRQPREHLERLCALTAPGGELVLESLVLPDDMGPELRPEHRYANMRNVWCIPSRARLVQWIEQAGFEHARVADISITTPAEQRSTAWMPAPSLEQALHPLDASRTIEGYPAPRRVLVIARRPPYSN